MLILFIAQNRDQEKTPEQLEPACWAEKQSSKSPERILKNQIWF